MNQVLGLPVVGALTLAFDRQIAEALLGVSLAILVLKKQPDYQRKIPRSGHILPEAVSTAA
jgi:hypothetical protein